MLTVRDFSQHLVSSSKTIRPNIPRGARCMGHCEMMWSAVCSLAPHSQFVREARPNLYMDEQKLITPERRRLSLSQAALGRPIPKGLVLALGMKAWSDDALAEYSTSHFVFVLVCVFVHNFHCTAGMRSVKTSISISCSHLRALIRIGLPQPYSQGSTGSRGVADQRRSATLTFRTPAGWHGIP